MKPASLAFLTLFVLLSTFAVEGAIPRSKNVDVLYIDFDRCSPEGYRIRAPLGSTTYKIIGPTPDGCVMQFGGEVKNPRWDGFLDKTCLIPFSEGLQSFKKTDTKVDFSRIEHYCKEVPRPKD